MAFFNKQMHMKLWTFIAIIVAISLVGWGLEVSELKTGLAILFVSLYCAGKIFDSFMQEVRAELKDISDRLPVPESELHD